MFDGNSRSLAGSGFGPATGPSIGVCALLRLLALSSFADFSSGVTPRLVLLASFDTCCVAALLFSPLVLDFVGIRLLLLRWASDEVARLGSGGGFLK